MEKSTEQLCKIASAGGSIKIDASKRSTEQLCRIASSAPPGNVIFEL